MRRATLAQASGRTIDLGAGTGANLGLYPDAVTDLVLAEPDPHMLRRLRAKAGDERRSRRRSSRRRPKTCLRRRQLRHRRLHPRPLHGPGPGQRRSPRRRGSCDREAGCCSSSTSAPGDAGLARWQDRLEGPWRFFGDGCHCNRDTVATIESSPLTVEAVELGRLPKAPPIVRPLARGSAVLDG